MKKKMNNTFKAKNADNKYMAVTDRQLNNIMS